MFNQRPKCTKGKSCGSRCIPRKAECREGRPRPLLNREHKQEIAKDIIKQAGIVAATAGITGATALIGEGIKQVTQNKNNSSNKEYWEVLGVDKDATPEEIRKAYEKYKAESTTKKDSLYDSAYLTATKQFTHLDSSFWSDFSIDSYQSYQLQVSSNYTKPLAYSTRG